MTNTSTDATRVAPPADNLTEQISALVSEDTRAYLLGSFIADRARSEGAVIRPLLAGAIERLSVIDPVEYERRMALGRDELSKRAASRKL